MGTQSIPDKKKWARGLRPTGVREVKQKVVEEVIMKADIQRSKLLIEWFFISEELCAGALFTVFGVSAQKDGRRADSEIMQRNRWNRAGLNDKTNGAFRGKKSFPPLQKWEWTLKRDETFPLSLPLCFIPSNYSERGNICCDLPK